MVEPSEAERVADDPAGCRRDYEASDEFEAEQGPPSCVSGIEDARPSSPTKVG
ncbi:hypothetical protein [Nocardia sp. NPDC003963]